MAKRTEVSIDSVNVFIRKFEPFLAVSVLGDLQKHVIGPASALFSMQEKKPGIELSEFSVERAIEKLSSGLDGVTLEKLARRLVQPDYVSLQWGELTTPVKATEGNVALAFEEDPFGALSMVMMEVVKVNFVGFSKRVQALFGQGESTATDPE